MEDEGYYVKYTEINLIFHKKKMYKLDDALLPVHLNCRGQLTLYTNNYNNLTLTISYI